MRILWHNLIVGILIVSALILAVRNRSELGVVVTTMTQIGPHQYANADEMTCGLITLMLICVTLVAIVRILVNNKGK